MDDALDNATAAVVAAAAAEILMPPPATTQPSADAQHKRRRPVTGIREVYDSGTESSDEEDSDGCEYSSSSVDSPQHTRQHIHHEDPENDSMEEAEPSAKEFTRNRPTNR